MEECGHRLIRHNYHLRFIEIDLITICPAEIIHLVEVKAWQSSLVNPLLTMTATRLKKLKKAAQFLLYELNSESKQKSVAGQGDLKQFASRGWDDIAVSFDLVWIKSAAEIEFYESLAQ